MNRLMQEHRSIALGLAIAFANLGVLGLLIGWNGASRAYGAGLHTMLSDHLAAVVIAWLVALGAAGIAGRAVASSRDLGLVLLGVVVADVTAGLAVAAGIGEITLVDLPRVLFTESVAGTQLAAVTLGLVVGHAVRPRQDGGAGEPEISPGR